MKLLPKSLFARLVLLIAATVVIAVVSLSFLFRQDRATLIARNFTDARMAEIEALRDALVKLPDDRPMSVQPLAREFRAILVPVDRRPDIGKAPAGPAVRAMVARLEEQLGSNTEVRFGTRLDQVIVWIRLPVTADKSRAVWAGYPMRNIDAGEFPMRLGATLAAILALLLGATYWFARRLTRPLSELSNAVATVAAGKHPAPLPVDGPSEIAAVAANVNKMAASLARLETDRRTMLAGISHDIRTPLTRLRLASEMSIANAKSRADVVADINEIDAVVTQFLDFARGEPSESAQSMRVADALAHIEQKAAANAMPITILGDALNNTIAVFPAAFERMLMNLVENAYRYGKPPVEISALRDGAMIEITVIDHGGGVAPEDAERLKQPFVRGDQARGGAMGAGLGLAIVDRLAAWHGASLDIARRTGGGNAARIRIPISAT
ncbi:MAG: HAMP domain-containing protein [Betaproteobacteria bacterium]|nr:MAG: HAMP domain-containing protein [Betaproteobacteria bacterium]